jgi:hypothetical protein
VTRIESNPAARERFCDSNPAQFVFILTHAGFAQENITQENVTQENATQ